MSTEMTPITTSMLAEYLGVESCSELQAFSAMALLAWVLNGEYDLEALRREILEETQP